MDPIDFLKTADLLKSQTEQAHLRTSAGRSYYAVFLYFREFLRSLGVEKKIKPGNEEHAFVTGCLANSQVLFCSRAAQYINNLKQIRTDADYSLDKCFSQSRAEDAFEIAKKLLKSFLITEDQKQTLYQKAKQHAEFKGWM
jgi:hypothetical protein